MRDYQSFEVRNVSVIGHSGAGKTSVLEAMLYYTKATDRFGKTTEGSSMIDFDAEEIRRGISVYTTIVPIEWEDSKINFIDTPGYLDFVGEKQGGFAVGDSSLIVVNAKDPQRNPVVIPDVDGGGFQDLPILGPGQIGQVIVELFGIPPQGFQNHMGGPVPHLASGDVSVFNGNDGSFRVIGGKIVDHHLAVRAELTGDPLCQRQEKLQRRCIRHVNPLLFRSAAETPPKRAGQTMEYTV